jgi:hypothetical protein
VATTDRPDRMDHHDRGDTERAAFNVID